MDFKFMTAEEMTVYQEDVKIQTELHELGKEITKASNMAEYYTVIKDDKYSEEAIEELKRSGYKVSNAPFHLQIGWENPADAEEKCRLVQARVQKEYTDEAVQNALNTLSLRITGALNKDPQIKEFHGDGKLPRTILKILKEKRYSVAAVKSVEEEPEGYTITW